MQPLTPVPASLHTLLSMEILARIRKISHWCDAIVADQTYVRTEMSTREVVPPVYTELTPVEPHYVDVE